MPTINIDQIRVPISAEGALTREVQPRGIANADDAFVGKRFSFKLLVYYFNEGLPYDNRIAPREVLLVVDNTTLVNADGSYAAEGAVAGENGVMGEFDWLITAFQVGGLDFGTFFPFVITRADSLGRFN